MPLAASGSTIWKLLNIEKVIVFIFHGPLTAEIHLWFKGLNDWPFWNGAKYGKSGSYKDIGNCYWHFKSLSSIKCRCNFILFLWHNNNWLCVIRKNPYFLWHYNLFCFHGIPEKPRNFLTRPRLINNWFHLI